MEYRYGTNDRLPNQTHEADNDIAQKTSQTG